MTDAEDEFDIPSSDGEPLTLTACTSSGKIAGNPTENTAWNGGSRRWADVEDLRLARSEVTSRPELPVTRRDPRPTVVVPAGE